VPLAALTHAYGFALMMILYIASLRRMESLFFTFTLPFHINSPVGLGDVYAVKQLIFMPLMVLLPYGFNTLSDREKQFFFVIFFSVIMMLGSGYSERILQTVVPLACIPIGRLMDKASLLTKAVYAVGGTTYLFVGGVYMATNFL